MSIITGEATTPLHLWQARTFDVTWKFFTDKAETTLMDLTGWHAWLKIWGPDITAPVKVLSDATGTAPTTTVEGVTGVIMGGVLGTVRVYLTDEDAALIQSAEFTSVRVRGEANQYVGSYELVLENPASEQYPYEVGPVQFHPTVSDA